MNVVVYFLLIKELILAFIFKRNGAMCEIGFAIETKKITKARHKTEEKHYNEVQVNCVKRKKYTNAHLQIHRQMPRDSHRSCPSEVLS